MSLPDDFVPYVSCVRRFLWTQEGVATQEGLDGPAAAFHARRIEVVGTTLPSSLPYRAPLLDAGILALEELLGAGVKELKSYGLSLSQAENLITILERGDYAMNVFQTGIHSGEAYDEDEVALHASATRTASVTTSTLETGDRNSLRLDLVISAASGTTPTLQVQIETRRDSSDSWRVVDAFPIQSTTTTGVRRCMAGLDRTVRAVCTIAGTNPSFTFALTGEAV